MDASLFLDEISNYYTSRKATEDCRPDAARDKNSSVRRYPSDDVDLRTV
jgi:hypothetical protein